MSINLYIKMGLSAFLVLLHIIQYHILPVNISKQIYIFIVKTFICLTNSQIRIHGNCADLNNNNLLIMSNHYDGILDANILFNIYYKNNDNNTLCSIVKSNIMTDKENTQLIIRLMSYIKNGFINSFNLIPYKRGDKEDGQHVKNIILDSLHGNKNILIFPEGTTRTNGIPKDFKIGIFQLAVENKLRILPITLKFEKDIGSEIGEPIKLLNMFDNVLDVYIHDLIDETDECYKKNDFLALKQKTFNVILSPMGVNPHTPHLGEN